MLVIFGITLPKEKKVAYALTILYGIGKYSAEQICRELGFAPKLTVKDLTDQQQFEIAKKIKEEFRLEGNLREEVKGNVQRYITNGSIRGSRHKHHLPVRGQRTHSNGKTARRVVMGIALRGRRDS
ncbi:MAG: 30S ribosomal protein S13 [Flavobacterium sp.]|jgi:small subunit ribosomal protein S13|nr:MAG: 30S ribosomal protein S13 [Flavobacterium sp.]